MGERSGSGKAAVEPWPGIEPGDFGWDEGGGIVSWLIRRFSHSPYAHCWVFHEQLTPPEYAEDGSLTAPATFRTVEAYPGKVQWRVRDTTQVDRVMRLWRTEEQRVGFLRRSEEMVDTPYAYGEVARIVTTRLRRFAPIWLAVAAVAAGLAAVDLLAVWAAVLAAVPLLAGVLGPSQRDTSRRFCSSAVAQVVSDERPEVMLSYPHYAIWPGRLERDLGMAAWRDVRLGEGL